MAKNIGRPIQLYRVEASATRGTIPVRSQPHLSWTRRPAVAVLPFRNLGGNPEEGYFGDGITEDIITALGRFSNLLVIAKSASFQLKDRNLPPGLDAFKDFPAYLELIEEEAYRCKEITGSLLQFVRDPGSRRVSAEVNVLIEKALELLSHQPRFAESRLVTDLDHALPLVLANEGQLRQVFLGLAGNALEAMDGRGTLTVTTRRRGGREVEITFADEGPGIPTDVLPRVFDLFFTTKPPGQGTGLGLAIAQGIVVDHGGRIEVSSRPGAGATFRVILTVGPDPAPEAGP
jgi:signal transduction histidine kinase